MSRSLGLDVHQATIYVTALDLQAGTLEQYEVAVEEKALQVFEQTLRPDDRLALEATTNSYYFHRRLRPRVASVVIANPIKLRPWIAQEDKSDRNDSFWLALLNNFGRLPSVWVPDEETEQDRRLLSLRTDLVQEQTRCLNRIRALLASNGLQSPVSDLRGRDSRGLVFRLRSRLPETARLILDVLLQQLDSLGERLEPVNATVALRAGSRPEVSLLMTVPGLDQLLSLSILAAIGDIERFPSAASLVKYAGLGPRENSSAGKPTRGTRRKPGSRRLRWAVTQAATTLVKRAGRLRNLHRRLKRKGENLAMAACARKLLVWIWHILKTGEAYRDRDPKLCERKRNRAATRMSAARRTLAGRPSSIEKLMKHAPLLKELSGGKFGLPVGLRSLALPGECAIPQGTESERLFERLSTA